MKATLKIENIVCPYCHKESEVIVRLEDETEPYVEFEQTVTPACANCKKEFNVCGNFTATVDIR